MRDTRLLEARAIARTKREFAFDALAPTADEATLARLHIGQGPRAEIAGEPRAALTSYSLTPSSTTVTEGNFSITFTITRSGDKPVETIYASTLFDTARSPGDYDGLVNLAITFSSSQTSKTFTVGINDDGLVEATEHFRVMIGRYTTDQSAQALDISDINIQDDDSPTQYSLTPSSVTRTEGDTSITFTVTRTGGLRAETIYASTLFDTARSSTGDYDPLVNGTVSFSLGEESETFTVNINEDSEVESTEHFRVMIARYTSDQSAQALDISEVYIEDDDAAAPPNQAPTITGPSSVSITAGQTVAASTLFTGATDPDGSIAKYRFSDATPGAGYLALNGVKIGSSVDVTVAQLSQLTYVAGTIVGTNPIVIEAIDNLGLDSNDLTVTVNVVAATTTNRAPTITGPSSVSIIAGQTVAASTLFTGATDPDGSIAKYRFSDATPGAGYLALNGVKIGSSVDVTVAQLSQLTYVAGTIVGTNPIVIEAIDNLGLDSNDLTVTVNVVAATTAPTFTIGNAGTVTEGSNAVFLVTMNGTISSPVTVWYSTLAGTASAAAGDYSNTFVDQPLTFNPGDPNTMQIIIPIRVENPNPPEGPESFSVGLQSSQHGSAFVTGSATIAANGATPPTTDNIANDKGTLSALQKSTIVWSTIEQNDQDGNATDADYFRVELEGGRRYTFTGDARVSNADTLDQLFIRLRDDQGHVLQGDPSRQGATPSFYFDVLGTGMQTFYLAVSAGGSGFSEKTGDYSVRFDDSGASPILVPTPPSTPDWGEDVPFQTYLSGTPINLHLDPPDQDFMGPLFGLPSVDLGIPPPKVILVTEHIPGLTVAIKGMDKAVESLKQIFEKVFHDHPSLFGHINSSIGMYANRYERPLSGTSSDISNHAWGIAIDLKIDNESPDFEQDGKLSRGLAILIPYFNAEGWASGAGYGVWEDDMHFEVARSTLLQWRGITASTQGDQELALTGNENQTLLSITGDPDAGTSIRLEAQGEQVLVTRATTGDAILQATQFSEVAFTGGSANDTLAIGPLAGTHVAMSTVFYEGLGGNDILDASSADRRVVADGGEGNDSLIGGHGDDVFDGGEGNDHLDGGPGADAMTGGAGDDTFFIDNAADAAIELAGEGNDRIHASVDYTLDAGSHIEILSTDFHAGINPIALVGNELGNVIYGNAGANILDGRGGSDWLEGLGGNDSYYVDSAGDHVSEASGGGFDRIYASADYTLYAGRHVEILSTDWHAGTASINLGGNELDNVIYGNAGANILYGKGGRDWLEGLGGNDSYYVDSAGDIVVEGAGGGFDRVYASADYTLFAGQQVEILSTDWNAGTAAIALGGNELDNIIYGNAGNNVLYGKGGRDWLEGLGGDDSYYVDSAGDYVREVAGGGTDRIYAGADYTLYASQIVEFLTTDNNAGTAAIALGGNEFANTIYGNDGNNILYGKEGNDTLLGLGGNDQFWFNTALGAGNVDSIYGFASGSDKVVLFQSIFTGLASGALSASAFVTGNAAQDSNDRIIYNSATGALLYDADGNGGGAAIQFATLNGAPAISAGDFIVF